MTVMDPYFKEKDERKRSDIEAQTPLGYSQSNFSPKSRGSELYDAH